MKGLVGGAVQGTANCGKKPDYSRGGACCLGKWWVQSSAECNEGTRTQQNRYRVAPTRQTGAHECTWSYRRTSRTSGRNHLSQELSRGGVCFEVLTFTRLSGQLVISPKSVKQFDDDEWIRSLTEAQEITADVPEDSVLHDKQAVDPKKVRLATNGLVRCRLLHES